MKGHFPRKQERTADSSMCSPFPFRFVQGQQFEFDSTGIGWKVDRCVNPTSRFPLAAGGREFTQPRSRLLADPCILSALKLAFRL